MNNLTDAEREMLALILSLIVFGFALIIVLACSGQDPDKDPQEPVETPKAPLRSFDPGKSL